VIRKLKSGTDLSRSVDQTARKTSTFTQQGSARTHVQYFKHRVIALGRPHQRSARRLIVQNVAFIFKDNQEQIGRFDI
jgi:hypothetical protein